VELDLHSDWHRICAYVDKAMKAGIYVSLATVGQDGAPTVMPIGSLGLDADRPQGFYLEKFPHSVAANVPHNPNFCILAEDTKLGHILRQLRGRGDGLLGVKLYGMFGERRPANEAEKTRIHARLPLSRLPGLDKVLFSADAGIRELTFTSAEAIALEIDRKAGSYRIL